jgi:hypothetical protein
MTIYMVMMGVGMKLNQSFLKAKNRGCALWLGCGDMEVRSFWNQWRNQKRRTVHGIDFEEEVAQQRELFCEIRNLFRAISIKRKGKI